MLNGGKGRGIALGAFLLSFGVSAASAQIVVSANDNKVMLVNGVNTVVANPPPDTVTIIDLGQSPPKVLGELNAPTSVVGPLMSVCQEFCVASPSDPSGSGIGVDNTRMAGGRAQDDGWITL